MQTGGRRALGALAIVAIALHAILWGIAPLSAGPAADPFSVICHSDAAAPSEQAPAGPASVPVHACDHCNLCSATPNPVAPAFGVTIKLVPARIAHVLHPASAAVQTGITSNPNHTRGPPHFA